MKTLYQTKNPELIAPLNKITPPPPNSHKTYLNKGSRPKYFSLLKQLTVIAIVSVSAVISLIGCSLADDSQGVTIAPLAVIVTEIPKRTNTDVRDSYVLFNIKANRNVSNYHLAVQKKGEAKLTAAEMINGALKRNLSTTVVNVLIAQRLDAPMITFAKIYFTNSSYTTLGAGMTGNSFLIDRGLIYDGADNAQGKWMAASEPWVAQSVLESNTEYVLYGMENGSTIVNELSVFRTDTPSPVPTQTSDSVFDLVDSTLEKGYVEIVLNKDEYYIFPLQGNSLLANGLHSLDIIYSEKYAANVIVQPSTKSSFGGMDPGYTHQLYLFCSESTTEELYNKGMYVLLNTAKINTNGDSPVFFGKYWTSSDFVNTRTLEFSALKIQE